MYWLKHVQLQYFKWKCWKQSFPDKRIFEEHWLQREYALRKAYTITIFGKWILDPIFAGLKDVLGILLKMVSAINKWYTNTKSGMKIVEPMFTGLEAVRWILILMVFALFTIYHNYYMWNANFGN